MSIKQWFIEKLLGGYVKKIIDLLTNWLGVDGSKTVIGVILLLLAAIAQAQPEAAPFVAPIIEFLKPYAYDLFNAGLGTTLVGIIHKIGKRIEKKNAPEE